MRSNKTLSQNTESVPGKGRPHFATTDRNNVPNGRNGKHKGIVTAIFADLDGLADGKVLKIPLNELHDTKVNVRSALSREARKLRKDISTAADEEFLYVWNS